MLPGSPATGWVTWTPSPETKEILDGRIAPPRALGPGPERLDRLPLTPPAQGRRPRAPDARGRRGGRDLQPDDLPEGDRGGRRLRRAAACGPRGDRGGQ